MKTFLLMLVLLLSFGISTKAQEIDKMPLITVSGSADVMVQPDEVVLVLNVSKKDMDMQVAKKQSDETIKNILQLARRFSVEPKDVKTDYISMDMKYESIRDLKNRVFDEDGDEIGRRVFKGYEVSTSVIVRLIDLSRFEDFFSQALKTGVSEISSVKFETSKLRENKDMARDMALKAAKEKATAMAASVGQTIGKAVKISEVSENQNYYSNASSNSVGYANVSSITTVKSENLATFAPGAIKISAQVTVSFVLN